MESLLNWFSSFSETIFSMIQYVVGLIEDIVKMVIMLGIAAAELPQIFTFLPPQIVAILGVFLTAAILYKVIGREG